ncbi:MAG TPA: hypothetical protein VIM19_17260 [Actinomycetes bacterium]
MAFAWAVDPDAFSLPLAQLMLPEPEADPEALEVLPALLLLPQAASARVPTSATLASWP